MTGLTRSQKAAILRAARQPNFVDNPRNVTAEALVRRGYAEWYDQGRGQIRLTLAGARFSRTGRQIEHGV